tara:strand:+ start:333 stop:1019 length:687 start_codon:yes stop_codon:yes gene_type:complete
MNKFNFDKYKNNGIGLSKKCLQIIFILLETKLKNINILEFGSGFSTQFFIDYKLNSKKNIIIDSFDNDINYSYKNQNNYNFLKLHILPLVSCNDKNFNKLFYKEKKYNKNYFNLHKSLPYNHPKYWRQRNCFYNITNELNKKYDIVLIDGPNGNGRNIAYLHLLNKLNKNAFIIIDDYNSKDNEFDYNFIGYLKLMFNIKEIYTHTYKSKNGIDEWENGGNFAIYQLL